VGYEPQKTGESCLRCGAELVTVGVQEFRTGGTSGAWSALFDIAHWGEGVLGFEILACPECRRVELRVPEEG
jgi:hypothetical protein